MRITIKDVRLEGKNYEARHGTTTSGILKAIATAIENPDMVVRYEDKDTKATALMDKLWTLFPTTLDIKRLRIMNYQDTWVDITVTGV